MVILRTSYAKGMKTKSGKAGECVISNACAALSSAYPLASRFWRLQEELATTLKGEARTSGGRNGVGSHQEWGSPGAPITRFSILSLPFSQEAPFRSILLKCFMMTYEIIR